MPRDLAYTGYQGHSLEVFLWLNCQSECRNATTEMNEIVRRRIRTDTDQHVLN